MTNPVTNDKFSSPYPATSAGGGKSTATERSSAGGEAEPTGPNRDSADLERASARFAQRVRSDSSIDSAEQAREKVAHLRELIAAAPQEALQAHGWVGKTSAESVLRFP